MNTITTAIYNHLHTELDDSIEFDDAVQILGAQLNNFIKISYNGANIATLCIFDSAISIRTIAPIYSCEFTLSDQELLSKLTEYCRRIITYYQSMLKHDYRSNIHSTQPKTQWKHYSRSPYQIQQLNQY